MGFFEEILECARAGISVGIRPLTTPAGYEVLEVVLERRKQRIGMLVNELNVSSVLSYEELLCLTIKELRGRLHWKSEPHVHVELKNGIHHKNPDRARRGLRLGPGHRDDGQGRGRGRGNGKG